MSERHDGEGEGRGEEGGDGRLSLKLDVAVPRVLAFEDGLELKGEALCVPGGGGEGEPGRGRGGEGEGGRGGLT